MDRVDETRSDGGSAPLLKMTGLVKRFTGTLALDHVDFDVRRGEVHALLGQNGAGKSTLIKVLAGVYEADAGEIVFDGRPAQPGKDALPIAFIHQDLGLVEWMTIAENVAIETGYPRSWSGLISWPKVKSAAAKALAIMGSDLDPEAPISSLPAAERSLVAIGRALAIRSDIVVLDEPTAALPEADVERLLETLRRLRANNIGIVYVTHRLDEVLRIADRVTVLRDGRRLATVKASDTNAGELVQMIVGRSMSDAFVRPTRAFRSQRLFGLLDLVAEHVGPVSFSVAAGEILGLVGLRGAGHHTVGRAIFGHTPMASGRLMLDGQPIAPSSPAEAMANGVGFVSSRRAEEGLASNLDVRENIYLNPAASGRGVLELIPRATELSEAQAAVRRFSIKTAGVDEPVATLSGGNQQKVVLARWMEAHVKLLILEEPTIGVDVGAKADIYHLLQSSLREGIGGFADLVRFRGGRAHLPSRAGLQPRTSCGGDSGPRPDGRRADVGGVGRKLDRSPWSDFVSRERRPLLRRRRHPSDLRMGPACPLRSSGHRVFIAEAGHVSHLFQYPLHPQQQVGAAHGGAFGLHSDGRQSVRPLGRIQCRNLAGARDRAARPGLAVVGGGVRVLLMGATVGLMNGLLTHPGEDQFVHRHARHGLDSVRTQRLVHRRPAGAGFAAAGVSRHFRQRLDRAGAGDLFARRQPHPVDGLRIPAPRPLSLCARREPTRGGAQRHFGQTIHNASPSSPPERSPPLPASCFSRSCRSAKARSARNIFCRLSPRRCSAPLRSAPAGSMSGERCSPWLCWRDGRWPQSARRAVLCRAFVQWFDADSGGRPRGPGDRTAASAAARWRRTRRPRAQPPRSLNNPDRAVYLRRADERDSRFGSGIVVFL